MTRPAKWHKGPVERIAGDAADISVVFTWDLERVVSRAVWLRAAGYQVRVGGPAVHVRTKARDVLSTIAEIGGALPDAVRLHNPDATFASRGCPVGCWFCIVPSLEGREFTLIDDFEPRPILCDNNLSALPPEYQAHIVARYRSAGVPLLDANSGFEPRTFDLDVFELWRPINRGPWRFACDDAGDAPYVWRTLEMLRDLVPNNRRKRVYVLIGNEPVEACMERIVKVIELGAEPYSQPVMKLNATERRPWVRFDWTEQLLVDVARWVNQRRWKYCSFAEYRRSARSRRRDAEQTEMAV